MASDGAKGFIFEPGGIGSILKTHRLRVPTFQREYAWESEQVDQLFNDLNRAKSEHTDHFLGTIVTISKGQHDPLEIVDGQQRLTTIALLITAIREVMSEIGQEPKVIESINNDYLSSFDRKAGGHVPRLTLNIDDNAFFAGIVGGAPPDCTRESHKRLLEAYRRAKTFIRRIVSTFAGADKPTTLNDWLEFIEFEASVILVKADNASKAFKMFETLNDRGLKTSQADLVKSYLFGEAASRVAEAQSRWSSMKDNLEEIDDDDRAINFLRHAIIATKRFVRSDEIYNAVQLVVRGEHNAASFLSSLEATSRTYVATFQPSADFWRSHSASTAKALKVFNQFDLKPIRPLMLSLAMKYSPKDFGEAIKLLVSISVRLVVAGRTRSGSLEQAFASSALAVFEDKITNAKLLKASLGNVIVSDADFNNEFKMARVSNAGLARYYLGALEAANAGQSEPWYILNEDPTAITLEHILPQNISAGWDDIGEEVRKLYTRRLGNLCLLQKSGNGDVGNKSFKEKRVELLASPLVMTSMAGQYEQWTETEIEERQTKLAEIALKTWPV
ncbi:DUF262 domain-containing protein [Nitrosospira sp. Nsp13]|uniref:DUF262 domain-containing protein n=1 Tax=Nitrosospira sp. Nsp13 TaxID=1855332 RepID=UPI00088E8301|nr:DUF262 domain-containing protein [Nitrosospira sp. Nsp13]SCY54315.1 Uncharacterized conserved protein, contains ParB-like and HNH nuclease domains [Nitrosospira sp. Nsp13]